MARDDLFAETPPAKAEPQIDPQLQRHQPLAARMRPRDLNDFVGQSHILAPGQLLRRAIEAIGALDQTEETRSLIRAAWEHGDQTLEAGALTAMGRKEIAEAAGASNRFLDRPVKAIDKDTGIGADLTELRRTVEALDPKEARRRRARRPSRCAMPR